MPLDPDHVAKTDLARRIATEVARMKGENTALQAENRKLRAAHTEYLAALAECREYFENIADADQEPGDSYPRGNREMELLVMIDEATGKRPSFDDFRKAAEGLVP